MMLPYPTQGFFQHPTDEVLAEIFQEMERRNWSVPGTQYTHDRGQIETISGNNFRLWFARRSDQYIYFSAVRMAIPGKELTVFRTPVHSVLKIYKGNNWEKDREWFLASAKGNARYLGQPRRYIVYEECDGTMKNHEENGHEYGLQESDPQQYSTKEIYVEFSHWLKLNVLGYITKHK